MSARVCEGILYSTYVHYSSNANSDQMYTMQAKIARIHLQRMNDCNPCPSRQKSLLPTLEMRGFHVCYNPTPLTDIDSPAVTAPPKRRSSKQESVQRNRQTDNASHATTGQSDFPILNSRFGPHLSFSPPGSKTLSTPTLS